MLKAILISIGFIVCGAALSPIQAPTSASNLDFTLVCSTPEILYTYPIKIDQMVKEITKKWLPEKIPKGMRHTTIHIYLRDYNRAWCTRDLNIYIYSNREHLDETLKHELTHALLLIRYPDLPRWTHEGIASRWDGTGHQKIYQSILAWSRRSGTYPRLHEIMQGIRFNSYNSTAYTASNSLVKFLLSLDTQYTLFLYASGKCTLERAYGFKSVGQLQEAWVKWLNEPVIASKP